MRQYIFEDQNGVFYKRISKQEARKRYQDGLSTIFCPVNMHPFHKFFRMSIEINPANINCNYQAFETVLNAFEWYNCNSETGYYTAFYIPVKEVTK